MIKNQRLNPYQRYIALSRYARFLPDRNRRESWEETVARYCDYFAARSEHFPKIKIYNAIVDLKVMPSMRALMTAGKALDRDNVAGYNCSYIAVDDPRAFDEALYVLMCFAPETEVRTKEGTRKISELTHEDLVLSYNEHSGKYSYISPSNIVMTPSATKQKIELQFEDGTTVKCTADHRFFTSNRGWVEAQHLTEEDEVKNYHEIRMKIISKTLIEDERDYWDITVPENHTFVLANGTVVHNCGTGLGFSVERQFCIKLPEVSESFHPTDTVLKVKDSKLGWAASFRELISMLYAGRIPQWDLSALRGAGAPLKTFGGRSSGPAPLNDLFNFTCNLFKKAAGRRLSSLECHDLMCKIADVVVVGGVRRSALISLSNLSDDRMRGAKNGQWWMDEPHRALANNSAAYTEKPDIGAFMKEWLSLYDSKSGERGIVNRVAAKKKVKSLGDRRKADYEFGTNPCGEIILRPQEFCNLTEVVIREEDTLETLLEKIEIATILGTFQSTLTDFRYLRSMWKKNVEEERLLGVSLTGIMDHPVVGYVSDEAVKWLNALREHSVATNKKWADILGIPVSASITTVKPSGTVSQLVDSSSGIHPRMSHYYVRTVRNDKKDPLSDFLIQQGVPCETDVMKDSNWVFSFPMKSPKHCRIASEMTAIDQLEHYLMVAEHFVEHNPSITVYVREHEWLQVGSWVYDHFDQLNGVSFLPYNDTIYQQAPYQPITEEQYDTMIKTFPEVDFDDYKVDEHEDKTQGAQMLACVAGNCDI